MSRLALTSFLFASVFNCPSFGQGAFELFRVDAAYPMLNRYDVRLELGLTDEQVESISLAQPKLRQLHASQRAACNAVLATLKGEKSKSKSEEIYLKAVEEAANYNVQIRELVTSSFTKQQRERLRELLVQYHLSRDHYALLFQEVYGQLIDKDLMGRTNVVNRERVKRITQQIREIERSSRIEMLRELWGKKGKLQIGKPFDFDFTLSNRESQTPPLESRAAKHFSREKQDRNPRRARGNRSPQTTESADDPRTKND